MNTTLPRFPPGFRFVPTNQELIIEYLKKKINNEPIALNCIHEVNIYKFNPWDLIAMYPTLGKDEWYFFTPRERKYLHGSRPNRAAGVGYWRASVGDTHIPGTGDCIGSKRSLVFWIGKSPHGVKTDWIMHEFTIEHPAGPTNDSMQLDTCVLCRIHKNEKAAASGETTDEPSGYENQVSRKRRRTGREDSSRQHDVPALPEPQQDHQQIVQILQPNPSMPEQNHHLSNLPMDSYGNNDIQLQGTTLPMPQQNHQPAPQDMVAASDSCETIHRPSENENMASHEHLITEYESSSHVPQQDIGLLQVQQNLPMNPENHQPAPQYLLGASQRAEEEMGRYFHDLEQQQIQQSGGFDYILSPEEMEKYCRLEDPGNNNEIYFDSISGEMLDDQNMLDWSSLSTFQD